MKRSVHYLAVLLLLTAEISVGAASPESSSKAAFNMGAGFFSDGRYAEAVHYFKKAVEKDPKNWKAYEKLGEVYSRLNLTDDALSAYQKCLKLNPKNKNAKEAVARLGSKAIASTGLNTGILRDRQQRTEVRLRVAFPFYAGNSFDRDVWKPDLAFGVDILRALDDSFSLGGRFDYFILRVDAAGVAVKYPPGTMGSLQPASQLMKILQIMPQLKWSVIPDDAAIRPYLTIGAGWMRKGFDDLTFATISPSTSTRMAFPSQNAFSIAGGVGLPLQINEGLSLLVGYDKNVAYGDAGNDDFDSIQFGLITAW